MLSPIPGSGASVVNAIDQPKVMIATYATGGCISDRIGGGLFFKMIFQVAEQFRQPRKIHRHLVSPT
jgi:hypothetical protein